MGPILVLSCCLALALADPTVEGSLGKISGKIDTILGVDIEAFTGIPYAKPPVGKLRFALPEPFGAVGEFEANKYGAACPQHKFFGIGTKSEEEDCLTLNVFRKSGTKKDDKKAVVAIVHGGGYCVGSSADIHQSAEPLAGVGDVIVVSFNYRLGVFGFADMKDLAPANLGLRDQRMALQWIQDNIADFGGDPKQVTIMGVSAGSMSVAAQIVTTLDKKDLFQAAVLDAGVVASHGFLEDPESSFVRMKKLAEEAGCPLDSDKILECLRGLPAGALLKNSMLHAGSSGIRGFIPTKDGVFLPLNTEEYIAENSADLRKVRTIVGYSLNEGSMFVNLVDPKFDFTTPRTKEDILNYCENISGRFNFPFNASQEETQKKIAQLYVDGNPGNAFEAVSSFIADGWFKCPINTFIKSYSQHNDKVFAYQFDRKLNRKYFKLFDPKILGAFHYAPYSHFGGAVLLDGEEVNEADKQFSVDAMNMISKFAKSDEAPKFRGVDWPSFSKSGEVFIFNETPTVAKTLGSETKCRELFSGHHQ